MAEDRMVVVLTPMTFYDHLTEKVVAARLEELGLTAYGHTKAEATMACKKLFNKFIRAYRARGEIADRLNQVDVTWYWEDEYPPDSPEYEDTNDLLKNWIMQTQQPQNSPVILAAAA